METKRTMKKVIVLVLILMFVFCSLLAGCGKSYKEADTITPDTITLHGDYFTVVEEWGGPAEGYFYILCANDTKVMYYYYQIGYRGGITPLYNADGSLQIYTEGQ